MIFSKGVRYGDPDEEKSQSTLLALGMDGKQHDLPCVFCQRRDPPSDRVDSPPYSVIQK